MSGPQSEFDRLLRSEVAAEGQRARAHAREAARHGGVAWSGCAPEPFRARSADEIRETARRKAEDRATWRRTASGRFLAATTAGQRAAAAAHQACERARAAWSRDFDGEVAACAAAAEDMKAEALRLLASARLARQAALSADAPPRAHAAAATTSARADAPG